MSETRLPHDFSLAEWKGKVDPREHRREMIDLTIIAAFFILAGLASATGLVMWVKWTIQLIRG